MKNALASFALLWAILAAPTASFAESEACMAATAQLDAYLMALPKTCVKNDDCRPFYFRADSCAAPVILSASVTQESYMMEMVQLQMAARTACAKDWASRPVCTPKALLAACRDGECVAVRPRR